MMLLLDQLLEKGAFTITILAGSITITATEPPDEPPKICAVFSLVGALLLLFRSTIVPWERLGGTLQF